MVFYILYNFTFQSNFFLKKMYHRKNNPINPTDIIGSAITLYNVILI